MFKNFPDKGCAGVVGGVAMGSRDMYCSLRTVRRT